MPVRYGVFGTEQSNPILDLIRSLGFTNLRNGPWVAGGSVRRLILNQHKTLSGFDIDIFGSSKIGDPCYRSVEQIERMLRLRPDLKYHKQRKTHDDFSMKGGIVQLITNRQYDSVLDLIEDFDFTVCMVATDGWQWVADERFFEDNTRKVLVMNNPAQRRNSLFRLAKYCFYGFTPAPGVLSTVLGMNKPDFAERFNQTNHLDHVDGY